MYMICAKCGKKNHISVWIRVSKTKFQCPTESCRTELIWDGDYNYGVQRIQLS